MWTVREFIHTLGQECDTPYENAQIVVHIDNGMGGTTEYEVIAVRSSKIGNVVILTAVEH